VIKNHVIGAIAVTILASTAAAAQDRPFLFSISTPPTETLRTTVHVDTSIGDQTFTATNADSLEQRIGVQAAFPNGVTLLARIGMSTDEQDVRTSQQAEVLYSVIRSARSQGSLAVGMGIRHESAGTDVLLGRVAAGRAFNAWRLDGNAVFEKPFASGRDAMDLITTAGLARRLSSAVHAGVEFIGEDLEGFWEADEAEGGARALVGPSIRIAPHGRRWQISVAAGPVFRATRSSASPTAAPRALPASDHSRDYAARMSFGYVF
jgi:hypothetical protein